jgi:hypothetical protein
MELDGEHAQIDAIWQDYFTRSRSLTSSSKHPINLNKMLEERQILLSRQKKDLKVWVAKLADEQVRGLHSFIGRDLPTDLEELHVCMAEVEDERAAEAGELSTLIIEACNTLVDL